MNNAPSRNRRALTFSILGAAASPAWAQSLAVGRYPDRPIKWLMPFPPGGGADLVARMLAEQMSPALNRQAFVIENRPGGQTVIATQALVSAKPDGYTVASVTDSLPINEYLLPKLPYTLADVTPISIFVKSPMVLVTAADVPGNTPAQLFSYMKAGNIAYGTWGAGSSSHLAMEYLCGRLNVSLLHVPFAGAAQAVTALLGGHIQIMWTGLTSAAPHVKSGKLKAWAVSTRTRSNVFPDTPALAEAGVSDFDVFGWNGMVAPRQTPPEIVRVLGDAIKTAMNVPDVRENLTSQGFVLWASTPEEFQEQMRRDAQYAKQVIETRNLKG